MEDNGVDGCLEEKENANTELQEHKKKVRVLFLHQLDFAVVRCIILTRVLCNGVPCYIYCVYVTTVKLLSSSFTVLSTFNSVVLPQLATE
jgi:hypothetical protein